MKIVIENIKIEGIPVLSVYSLDQSEKKPIVILLHGLNGSKEDYLNEAYNLAREGYYAITFDSYNHGELIPESFKGLDFWDKAPFILDVVLETTNYIDKIICEFEKNETIADCNRIALVGFSMGGSAIYNYVCDHRKPNIKAAVAVCTTPVWSSMFKNIINIRPSLAQHINESELERLERIEPIKRSCGMKDLPLLMINVEGDELAPIDGVRKGYEIIMQNYTHKELIKNLEYKGINHKFTSKMFDEAKEWIKTHI